MAEATLRGHVEIEEQSAKALCKAGWPVEVRYFIPKANTKSKPTPDLPTSRRAPRTVTPRNNFIGMGTKSFEHLQGDRFRVAKLASEAINKAEHKMVRRTKLRGYAMSKLNLSRQQAASQVSHLVSMGVLKDLGQYPPEWQKGAKS